MTASDDTQPLAPAPARAHGGPAWEACDHCQAPLDERQRYCVVCGTRRAQADDPASRYFAVAARRARAGSVSPATAPGGWTASLLATAIVALLPLAVGVGVLVGRGGAHADDRVVEALKAQKAPIVRIIGGGTGTGAAAVSEATTTAAVPSDFPAAGGFAIALKTLPVSGTTAADVTQALKALRAGGGRNVGVVNPQEFAITPAAGDVYTLVSGHFANRGAATRALGGVRASFPAASVVEVRATKPGSASSGGGTESKILASGPTGDAHQLEGAVPSKQQLQDSAKAIDTINSSKGKAYVDSQRNLPDSIVIP